MNRSTLLLQKALHLLDRDMIQRGEEVLREAIQLAEGESDEVTLARSLCCLGDLLRQLGRTNEAVPLLKRLREFGREDDLLDFELNRAREILEELGE